jgi:hypothetical protein
MNKLLSESGEVSSLRVIMLITFTVVILVWAWLCIKTQVILSIPESILSLLGLILATKWAQKTEETKIKEK